MTRLSDYPQYNDVGILAAPDQMTQRRWEQQRRRREMFDGTWREQLITAGKKTVGADRLAGWAPPSLARNLAETVCRELAVLWDQPSSVAHDIAFAGRTVTKAWELAGLQQQMQRAQLYTIGIGSCYVRVKGFARSGAFPRVGYEVVPPDLVYDIARDDGTGQPALVRQYMPRPVDGRLVWTADEWDIRDPESPVYRLMHVTDGDGGAPRVVEEVTGDAYVYRRADGTPLLPYVLFHDWPPSVGLHDPEHRASLFAGALDVAVLYWLVVHVFRDASWPQRAVGGLVPTGGVTTEGPAQARKVITMDPSTLAMFGKDPEWEGPPMQWQWMPGGDVAQMSAVLEEVASRLAVEEGISPADLQRASPNRSGYAIALTNVGKRAQRERFKPSFRPASERLAMLTASTIRAFGGPDLPDTGYRMHFGEIPYSPTELEARRRHAIEMVEAGLWSRAEAYRYLHADATEAEAEAAVAAIPTPTPTPIPTTEPTDAE